MSTHPDPLGLHFSHHWLLSAQGPLLAFQGETVSGSFLEKAIFQTVLV